MGKKRDRVPSVLWKLFRSKARTLSKTIISLIPKDCECKGKGKCLRCVFGSGDDAAIAYLIRPHDPDDYCNLMNTCLVVIPDDAPPLPPLLSFTRCWSQYQIVERTIQAFMSNQATHSNVICYGYQKFKMLSSIVKVFTHSTWDLVLKRVGASVMFYLLTHTLIFMPMECNAHQQIAGPPVNQLFASFSMHRTTHDFEFGEHARHQRKRRRVKEEDLISDESPSKVSVRAGQQYSFDRVGSWNQQYLGTHCPEVSSVLHLTDAKAIADDGSRRQDVPEEQSSENLKLKPRKRLRMPSWQRRKRCKRLKLQDSYTQEPSTKFFNVEDDLHKTCQQGLTSNQRQSLLVCTTDKNIDIQDRANLTAGRLMQLLCPCCLVFQSLLEVPTVSQINGKPMLYNLKSSSSLFLEKHVLYSLKPGLAGGNDLLRHILGLPSWITVNFPASCFHIYECCLHGSSCLYHSLVKLLKVFVHRAKRCQHSRLLEKHCSSQHVFEFGDGAVDFGSACQGSKMESSSASSKQDVNQEVGQQPKRHFNTESIDCKRSSEVMQRQFGLSQPYCLKDDVVSFVWAVCRNIVPPGLLGVPSNRRILRRNISRFIKLRRFEKFTLKQCMHKLEISKFSLLSNKKSFKCFNAFAIKHETKQIPGLMPHSSQNNFNRVKQLLLERWIFWFFSHIVVPLVQANFYVTESEHGKQNLYYYRKSVWEKLSNGVTTSLEDQSYRFLDNESVANILRKRSFGFSKVRFCPKETGARPIANLKAPSRFCIRSSFSDARFRRKQRKRRSRSRICNVSYFKSVNTVLRDLHVVLKDLKKKQPERWGSTVFCYNDIYRKLCLFVRHLKEGQAAMPTVYLVVSDVQKAFDTVKQDKLLSVLNEIQMEDKYTLRKSSEIFCRKKSLWISENLKLLTPSNSVFAEVTPPVCHRTSHTILVNQEQSKTVKREELQFNLKEHLENNVLKLGQKFFLQTVGIPQGSVLSTLLCTLYYGHLERIVICPYLVKSANDMLDLDDDGGSASGSSRNVSFSSPKSLLLRFVDDFLFISTSEKQAASFFSRLRRGFREYNCYMNQEKFCTNFDSGRMHKLHSKRVLVGNDGVSFLQWSGLLVNSCSLEVQADYSRYLNDHLSSTLTVSWQRRPGRQLKAKLCAYMRPKCHPIFFDATINSPATIRLNVYQAFVLCAMKFHCYIRELSRWCELNPRSHFTSIEGSLRYMYKLMKRRMCKVTCGSSGHRILQVAKEEVIWLGLTAYVQVLNKKKSRHKELLCLLRAKLVVFSSVGGSAELKYAVDDSHSSLLWKIKY